MTVDRAELAGTGAALVFHAGLIAALSFSLAHVTNPPEPPPMEVEMVDEVGLQRAAPAATPTPPPQAQTPDLAETPPQPEAAPTPVVQPTPQPRVVPSNTLAAQVAQLRPTPPRSQPARAVPAKSAPARPAPPRASRIGADFLKGIADAPAATAPARASAPAFDVAAKSSVAASIKRQIQPCADQQPFIGDGANRIQLSLNLRLNRSGRLLGPPTLVGPPSGIDDDNSRYIEIVKDQARRVFAACTPLRLPAELYQTPSGGWGNITIRYKMK